MKSAKDHGCWVCVLGVSGRKQQPLGRPSRLRGPLGFRVLGWWVGLLNCIKLHVSYELRIKAQNPKTLNR